jgi:hypothetical protein
MRRNRSISSSAGSGGSIAPGILAHRARASIRRVHEFICATCGTQHEGSAQPPSRCAICEDERQYVGWEGQRWTTLDELRSSHSADIREEASGLLGIGMRPSFAIGQRALLVTTPGGNVLWDCIPLLDEEIVEAVRDRGGLSAIAISHPHYYASMIEWAREFDVPVHLHRADRDWVMRPDARLNLWDGETLELEPGVTLVRVGGHFDGATVLHWARDGGALLCGDSVQVVPDRRWVGFMRSYPNLIPLPAAAVAGIGSALAPHAFERIHGAFWGRVVGADGSAALERSVARYLAALGDEGRPQ